MESKGIWLKLKRPQKHALCAPDLITLGPRGPNTQLLPSPSPAQVTGCSRTAARSEPRSSLGIGSDFFPTLEENLHAATS